MNYVEKNEKLRCWKLVDTFNIEKAAASILKNKQKLRKNSWQV